MSAIHSEAETQFRHEKQSLYKYLGLIATRFKVDMSLFIFRDEDQSVKVAEWTTFSNLESLRSKLKNAQVEETVTSGHYSESFTESSRTDPKTSVDLIAGRLNTGPTDTLSNQDCNRNIQPDSLLQQTYRVARLNNPFSVPTSHQYTGCNVQSGNQTEETLKSNVYMYSLEGKTTKRMKQSDTFCNPPRANNSVHIQDPSSVTSDDLFQRRICASVKETEVSKGSKNATDSLPYSKSSLQKMVDCTLPLSIDGSENLVLSRKTDVECLADTDLTQPYIRKRKRKRRRKTSAAKRLKFIISSISTASPRKEIPLNNHSTSTLQRIQKKLVPRPYFNSILRHNLKLSGLPNFHYRHFSLTEEEKCKLLSLLPGKNCSEEPNWVELCKEFIGRKPEDLRRAAIDLHRQNTGGEPSSRAHLLIDSAMGALCSEKSGRRNLHQKLQLRANGGITGLSSIEEMASNLLVRFRNPPSYHLSHAFTSGAIEDMVFTKRNNLAVSCIASTDAGRANNLLHLNWHDVDDGTSTIGQILSRPVALNSGGHRVKSRSPQSDYEYCTVSNVRVWDDRIMVSGGFDKKLKVWSMVDGCVVGSVDCHNGNIIRVDQHIAVPNLFVSASADGTGCILRVSEDGVVNSSHKRITRKRPLTGAQFGKQYSDGFVYFCTEAIENMEARVTVCDYRTFKVFQHFECDYNIGSMDISSNGKLLAYGTFPQSNNPHISVCSTNIMPQWGDRMIHLLDLQMGRECCKFFCDQQDVNVVSFSPCGTYIASAGIENHTTIFDVRLASKPLHILHHNSDNQEINRDGIADIKWLSSDVIATASSEEPVVRFWDIRLASGTHPPADVNKRATGAKNLIHSVEAPGGPVSRIAVSNDQSYFAIGTQMGSVALYSCSARDHYRLSTFPQEVQSI